MDLGQVPLSSGLLADLERLSAEYAALHDADVAGGAADGFEREMYRASLDARMRGLWQRARAELGRSYAIGLLGPGMTRPAWSPGEAGAPGRRRRRVLTRARSRTAHRAQRQPATPSPPTGSAGGAPSAAIRARAAATSSGSSPRSRS